MNAYTLATREGPHTHIPTLSAPRQWQGMSQVAQQTDTRTLGKRIGNAGTLARSVAPRAHDEARAPASRTVHHGHLVDVLTRHQRKRMRYSTVPVCIIVMVAV